ncbi:MAG: NifU family protein [Flavobacteriaceae bacterium]|jgi:Fe-S cluster biogenesis protein NfuA|uniref:NifU family protein n=1 Tax=Candidatus Arcticimaribacter forsetii TaxID=2820661 RepID=UPI0020772432|nr:NifU N-terminal domain-containing protein [Candidatus Arcticimaribacter forsetii]MCH1539750.1 NifU family protein [Flavobacteriaceae bacterium]MDB2325649.1 NifU family protein [Flavobacteriaceae bacterium]MDB2329692.1 NifU family protein [Flavobacteriaceae bacterium]
MTTYTITPSQTQDETIARFEISPALEIIQASKFNNIDEAKDAPLVQQMFYLPFVKSVVLKKEALEIERFSILEWKDVLEDVSLEIETYLNKGGTIINQVEPLKKVPITIYAESTPNPGVMKFVANKKLVDQIFEFKNIDETTNAPLAQKLFHFPFVKEVFMDTNYISITKFEVAEWDQIVLEIREFLRTFLEEGNEVIVPQKVEVIAETATSVESEPLDEISQQIVGIIEDYIKPAVAADGGNILFDSYNSDDKSVKVVLQGACSGCPSSTFTLKNGIENMLKEMLPGKISTVNAING